MSGSKFPWGAAFAILFLVVCVVLTVLTTYLIATSDLPPLVKFILLTRA